MLKKEKTAGHTPQKTVKWICELQLNFFMVMWQRWHHSFVPFSLPLATPGFISVFPNHLKTVDVSDGILNYSWRCVSVTLSIIHTWRAPHFSQKLLASLWSSQLTGMTVSVFWACFFSLVASFYFHIPCLLSSDFCRDVCCCYSGRHATAARLIKMVIRGRENRAGLPSNMSGDGIAQEKKGTSNKRNKPSVTRKSKRKQKRKEEKDREKERWSCWGNIQFISLLRHSLMSKI